MQDFFIDIYKIFTILQNFFILIITKNLLKILPIFLRISSCLVKSLVKELLIFF